MSLCLDTIAVDPTLAREGTWMEYMNGRFKLARKGDAFKAAQVEEYNKHRDLITSGTSEGNAKALEIERRLFADHILLDWDKIVDKEKNPIPYTPQLGYELICNPKFAELIDRMETYSLIHSNYQVRVDEEVADEVKSSAAS